MSLAEFSAAFKSRVISNGLIDLKPALESLLKNTVAAYENDKSELKRAASLFEQDSQAFRKAGSTAGSTKLVITGESLETIFKTFGGNQEGKNLMTAYIKFLAEKGSLISGYEIYNQKGNKLNLTKFSTFTGYYHNVKSGETPYAFQDVSAVRGLNFTHRNTANHIVEFINYIMPIGLTVDKFTDLFERGHIYAQTTGRLLSAVELTEESNVLSDLAKLSTMLDEASSHLNTTNHVALLASIKKDFTGDNISMNIEFQLKSTTSGTGNQDTGKLSNILRLVGGFRKLMTAGIRKKEIGPFIDGGLPTLQSDREILAVLADFHKKIDTNFKAIENVIKQHINFNPAFLADLRSSKSAKEHVVDNIVSILRTGKNSPRVAVKHSAVELGKVKTDNNKAVARLNKLAKNTVGAVKKLKEINKAKTATLNSLKGLTSKNVVVSNKATISLTSLQNLINSHLQSVISANMGEGSERRILNYRTGRFASSAKVETISAGREGMLTAYYSYMKYPYATFSEGGLQQYPKTRDPKLLISGAIREIAATKVGNRMRAVLI